MCVHAKCNAGSQLLQRHSQIPEIILSLFSARVRACVRACELHSYTRRETEKTSLVNKIRTSENARQKFGVAHCAAASEEGEYSVSEKESRMARHN